MNGEAMQKIGSIDRYRTLEAGHEMELSAGTHKIEVSTPPGALWYIDSETFLTTTTGKEVLSFTTDEPIMLGCTMDVRYYSPNHTNIHAVTDNPTFTKPYDPPARDLEAEALMAKVADRAARRTASIFEQELLNAEQRIAQLEAGADAPASAEPKESAPSGPAGTPVPEQGQNDPAGAHPVDGTGEGATATPEGEGGRGPDNGKA